MGPAERLPRFSLQRTLGTAKPVNPILMVTKPDELVAVAAYLAKQPYVGLDVETTLHDHTICLVQISTLRETWVIDAVDLADLSPLREVFASPAVIKVIHNAPFERRALRQHDLELVNVFDTLSASRRHRGRGIDGGHGLAAVCERELGFVLDKSEQTSDWRRRPLHDRQILYAALDAEILISLYAWFQMDSNPLFTPL